MLSCHQAQSVSLVTSFPPTKQVIFKKERENSLKRVIAQAFRKNAVAGQHADPCLPPEAGLERAGTARLVAWQAPGPRGEFPSFRCFLLLLFEILGCVSLL